MTTLHDDDIFVKDDDMLFNMHWKLIYSHKLVIQSFGMYLSRLWCSRPCLDNDDGDSLHKCHLELQQQAYDEQQMKY